MDADPEQFLVADVGGTNMRVAICDGTILREESIRRYRNEEYSGIGEILKDYMSEMAFRPDAAGIDIAGPVENGVGKLTNRSWQMSLEELAEITHAQHVAILNDLQAQGHALGGGLSDDSFECLIEGSQEPLEDSTKLVVNVGTGFNASAVFSLAELTFTPASECGHANLPIRTGQELELCQFMEQFHGFPAIEDVLSGRGMERVYQWCQQHDSPKKNLSSHQILENFRNGDALAERACEMFARILGRVCGNLALVHLPYGGIYLVGGIARALSPDLLKLGFRESFRDKGRFAYLMDKFSINTITDDYAALLGMAFHLQETMPSVRKK